MGLQLIVAAAVLQNKDQYVENNLRQSWIRAFDTDPRIILDIQREFRCQGFDEPAELMVEMPEFYGALMACKYALIARFGPKMYSIGVMTMIIRLIQVYASCRICLGAITLNSCSRILKTVWRHFCIIFCSASDPKNRL